MMNNNNSESISSNREEVISKRVIALNQGDNSTKNSINRDIKLQDQNKSHEQLAHDYSQLLDQLNTTKSQEKSSFRMQVPNQNQNEAADYSMTQNNIKGSDDQQFLNEQLIDNYASAPVNANPREVSNFTTDSGGPDQQQPCGLQAISVSYQTQNAFSREQQRDAHCIDQSSFNNDLAYHNPYPQAPPNLIANMMAAAGTTTREKPSHFNIFSNSFDESGILQVDKRPQRNCKSSTRKTNKTHINQQSHQSHGKQSGMKINNQQIPIPLIQNVGGTQATASGINISSTILTTGGTPFNNFLKSQPNINQQNQYQQTLLNQLQRTSGGGLGASGNSFDIKSATNYGAVLNQQNSNSLIPSSLTQDLSNRSHIVTQSQGLLGMTSGGPYAVNHQQYPSQYGMAGGSNSSGSTSKPITPHQNPAALAQFQSVILSEGSGAKGNSMQQTTPQSQQNNMDPYTYFKWKQQKYKSSRSIQMNNGGGGGSGYGFIPAGGNCPTTAVGGASNLNQIMRQNSNSNMNNSQQIMMNNSNNPYPQFQHTHMRGKGYQTSKNNKSRCSSGNGSIMNTSSTGLTMGGGHLIKNLSEVNNPQYFISLRFSDRKVTDLQGINLFKNLSELDISGNLLTQEIPELKQLQFLKKLNLSNNQIVNLYPLPQNLEILNLSYNKLKCLNSDVTQNLKSLTTLDVTQNGLETLDGIQYMKRLKRLISKNNQIQELHYLNDIETLIDIDLENNPVDNYLAVVQMLSNKKDILVVNLKLSPVFLTISSYDQLHQEIENSLMQSPKKGNEEATKQMLESFKNKFKHYVSGCLYRSKRAYQRMRAVQQHSKRSSSNFSNGSSSCGRATGGRVNTGGRLQNIQQINNSSNGNPPFSPLLNPANNVTTPNQAGQHATQRLEDIEQLYDEILDEEEEHERKLMRIQRKKLKKMGLNDPNLDDVSGGEDDDYEESMSMYEEDEDDLHPTMSFDEDIDDLQSYRNHHHGVHQNEGGAHNDFLNESTADFNKEIKQINQELREQFGNDLALAVASNNGNVPDHLQSFQSTQSLLNHQHNKQSVDSSHNTHKKNPISFKLDLSKCTNQQSEEDDEEEVDNLGQTGIDDMQDYDNQFEIPSLQFVKVTDDSFRQFNKQNQSNLKTKPANQENKTATTILKTSQNTIRGSENKPIQALPLGNMEPIPVLPKQQQPPKQIIIPKLQLGILQQQHNIPLKQTQISSGGQPIKNLSAVQSLRSGKQTQKSKKEQQIVEEPQSNQREEEKVCQNEQCSKLRQTMTEMRKQYQCEKEQFQKEISVLKGIISEIRTIFKISARSDIKNLPSFIRDFKNQCQLEIEKQHQELRDLRSKFDELTAWRAQQEEKFVSQENSKELKIKCEEKERTICDLQDQISKLLLSQREQPITHSYPILPENNFFSELEELNELPNQQQCLNEIKRAFSSQYQQSSQQTKVNMNNPQMFYNNSSSGQLLQTSGRGGTNEGGDSMTNQTEDLEASMIKMKIRGQKAVAAVGAPQAKNRKQSINQDMKKMKRPQSVATAGINQRRSSQGVKINAHQIKGEQVTINTTGSLINITQGHDEASYGANEYCSNQELITPLDLTKVHATNQGALDSNNVPLSQTMNRKVGHYLQRLKERNSSLQERLNGSFRDNSASHSVLNIVQSPTPSGIKSNRKMLNLVNHQQQDPTTLNNPYILSPTNNHRYNESMNKPIISAATGNIGAFNQQYQSVQIQQNNNPHSNMILGNSLNIGPGLLKKISYKEGSSSRRQQPNNQQQVNTTKNSSKQMKNNNQQQELQSHQHVNRFVNEYAEKVNEATESSTQSVNIAGLKQHSKTQRIHVNSVQYNQILNATGKAPLIGASTNSSNYSKDHSELNLSLQIKKNSSHHHQVPPLPTSALGGYQTHQPQQPISATGIVNLSQLFSGRSGAQQQQLMRQDSSQERTVVRQQLQNYNTNVVPNRQQQQQ